MKIDEVAGVGKIVKGVNTTPDVQPGETERQAKKYFGGTGKPKLLTADLSEKEKTKDELKGFDPRTVKAINNLMVKFPQAKDPLSAIIADIEDSQAISIANDKHTRQRNIQQDKQIDDLTKRVDKLEKSDVTEDEDMDTIQRAEQFAQEAHKDHKRKYTGDPYYTHLDEVRRIVKAAGGSENMQAAALLHDTVEDTATTSQDIMKEFGPAIAKLVVELTDISKPEDGNRATRKAMDRDKLAGASADAQTIKYADLISNGRDIGVNDPKFAKVYHKEKADLLRVMRKGNQNLRNAAIDMLPDELRTIATENLSYTGTERRRLEKKKGIEVGTPEWFKHWFDLPYLREGDNITYDELVKRAKYKSSIPFYINNMLRTLHSLVSSGGNRHSLGYYAQEVGRQFGFSGRDLEKLYRKEYEKPFNESTIQKVDIQQLETFADKLFGKVGIDVEFTKHFMDRVNDIRNQKPITMSELTRLFKQEYKRWGKPIAQLGPDSEAVMKDLQTDINLPFVLKWDSENNELDLVAKTVMRKADFKTNDREFPVENIVQEKNSKKDNIRLVLRIAKKLNIDPKIAMAIAYQESGFRDVIGDKNLKNKAYGLMQVRKPALDDVNRIYKTDFTMDDVANNPAKNVEIALKYFQAMKDNYGAESDEQALAGYNGGPNAIKGTNKKANTYAQSVIDTASTFKAPKKSAMQKPPARVYDTPIASNPQTVRPQVEPKKQLGPTPDASIIPPGTTKGGPSKLRQRLAKQAIKPDAQIDTPVVVKPKISKLRQRMMQKDKSRAVEPVTVSIPAPMPKLPTTYQDLAKSSGIKDPNKIFAGDIVNLPDGSKYTIKAGDTLSGIANFYNAGLKENVPNTNKPGTMGHMINWAGKNKPQAPTSRVQVARRPNKQEPQSWWQNVLQKGRNLFDGIESFTDPNFEVEWDEAKRYPEFVKIGKDKWIELAKTGEPIDVDNELANKIENTEAGEENRHEFDNLEEPKKERFRKAVKAGTVELPIIARYSDGYLELVAGNTRLTGMMNEFGEGKAWIFDVPDEVAVLGESEQLDLKKKFKITDELKQLDSIFKKDKHEIRIVGGAVRDLALGKTPKDIDLATDATPQEMQKMFDSAGVKHIPTGIEHGTITAVLNGEPYEITTLRADVETDGRRAEVEFVRSWEEDAKRRDLTYNAMSMDFEGNIYDYHGGMDDLQDKVTRFVGDPAERIKEDYLRTLRYFRFQGRLDTPTFDKDTMQAIASNTNGLKQLSVERVWMEMQKILGGGNIKQILGAMNNTGVLSAIGLKYTPNNDLMDGGDPIINLARITDDQSIGLRWKMSNEEKGKLGFLIAEKGKTHDKKWYTDMMADGFDRTQLDALARYNNQDDMIQYIKTFKAPEFPVDGNDLIKIGHERGPGIGKTLMALRNKWKAGNFSASKDELLKSINENFADGKKKGKSRPGRVKRAGASCKGSVSSLRAKAKKYSGERGKMYHWCANMKSGKNKSK